MLAMFRFLICNVYILVCVSTSLALICFYFVYHIIYILIIFWRKVLHVNLSFGLILWEEGRVMIFLLNYLILLIVNCLTLSSLIYFGRSFIIVASNYVIAKIFRVVFGLFINCHRLWFVMTLNTCNSLVWIKRRWSGTFPLLI